MNNVLFSSKDMRPVRHSVRFTAIIEEETMLKLFKRKQREAENNTAFHLEQYGCIIDVKRVECRPFYDSTWSVTVKDGDKDAETTNIVVEDTETAELMAGTVLAWYQKLRSLAEVKKNMDLRGSIYYD